MANLITEMKKNVSDIVNEMPNALLKFYEIIDNEDQTMQQIKVAMDELIAGNPKDFKPKGMGGPPCGPGGPGGPPGGPGGSRRTWWTRRSRWAPCVPPGGRPPRPWVKTPKMMTTKMMTTMTINDDHDDHK
ncbi:hypothetical protein OSTOST_09788 [Ostertagia ostertagi]